MLGLRGLGAPMIGSNRSIAAPCLRWHSRAQLLRSSCSSIAAPEQAECAYAHGFSAIQGPRDDMEDDACVLWDAESGSLYTGG
jgi:hypothetical protein